MPTTKAKKSLTKAEVWDLLSAINVNEHTKQKKSKSYTLTYLSWAWAYGIMMEHFPEHYVTWHGQKGSGENGGRVRDMPDVFYYEGGSAMVNCTVTIPNSSPSPEARVLDVTADMWLSVMDFKNDAIATPDTRAISDAKMRCMVKAYAMLGLGHYIYAGEDIPVDPSEKGEETKGEKEIEALITEVKTVGRAARESGLEIANDLVEEASDAVKGRAKTKLKAVVAKLKSLDK